MQLDGQAAIVTGGSTGLGGATVDRLTGVGTKVTIFDTNAEQGAEKAAATGAHFVKVDITDEDAVAAAIAEAEDRHGLARILVNCAGIGRVAKIIDRDGKAQPLRLFAETIAVNLVGNYNVLAQFAAALHDAEPLGEERGVIVNTASVAAFDGQIGQVAYCASKGGVVGMTLPIARELARYAIRNVSIAPGLFMTPMLAPIPPEDLQALGQLVPFPKRLGDPAEFAQLVCSIVTNPMLNGEVIRLDGAHRLLPK